MDTADVRAYQLKFMGRRLNTIPRRVEQYPVVIVVQSVDDEPQIEKTPMTKPIQTIDVKEAWCNPRADDECTINGKKVLKEELKQYLPAVYELEVLNAGGHCEYPICYDKNDKPIGIN